MSQAFPVRQEPAAPAVVFTGYQKFIVALLAFLQFTIVLDFMIFPPVELNLNHLLR